MTTTRIVASCVVIGIIAVLLGVIYCPPTPPLSQDCPSFCECTRDVHGLIKTDCKDGGRISVPGELPDNTAILDLTGNLIPSLSKSSWPPNIYTIEKLFLANISLTDIAADTLTQFTAKLRLVDFSCNRVKESELVEAIKGLKSKRVLLIVPGEHYEIVKARFPQHRVVKGDDEVPVAENPGEEKDVLTTDTENNVEETTTDIGSEESQEEENGQHPKTDSSVGEEDSSGSPESSTESTTDNVTVSLNTEMTQKKNDTADQPTSKESSSGFVVWIVVVFVVTVAIVVAIGLVTFGGLDFFKRKWQDARGQEYQLANHT